MSPERPADRVNERLLSLDDLDQPAASGWYWRWLGWGALTAVGGITFLLTLSEVFPMRIVRQRARMTECKNHLRRIGDALHSYRNRYGTYPPLSIRGEDGQPMQSWRTLILPEFTEKTLPSGDRLDVAQQVNLTVPWDHPSNAEVAGKTPFRFHCPASAGPDGKTSYLAVANSEGKMGLRVRGLEGSDSAVTLLVVEVPEHLAVPWMAPHDLSADQLAECFSFHRTNHLSVFQVLEDDGNVRSIIPTDKPLDVLGDLEATHPVRSDPASPFQPIDPALSAVRTLDVDAATLPVPVAAAAN